MTPCSSEFTVFRVQHGLDLETTPQVREEMVGLLTRAGSVVLDLQEATVDSTGLGAVLSLQRSLAVRNRRLLVVTHDNRFLSLVERAGVVGVLDLYPSADAALASIWASAHAA